MIDFNHNFFNGGLSAFISNSLELCVSVTNFYAKFYIWSNDADMRAYVQVDCGWVGQWGREYAVEALFLIEFGCQNKSERERVGPSCGRSTIIYSTLQRRLHQRSTGKLIPSTN